jgi:hypothetical protein
VLVAPALAGADVAAALPVYVWGLFCKPLVLLTLEFMGLGCVGEPFDVLGWEADVRGEDVLDVGGCRGAVRVVLEETLASKSAELLLVAEPLNILLKPDVIKRKREKRRRRKKEEKVLIRGMCNIGGFREGIAGGSELKTS